MLYSLLSCHLRSLLPLEGHILAYRGLTQVRDSIDTKCHSQASNISYLQHQTELSHLGRKAISQSAIILLSNLVHQRIEAAIQSPLIISNESTEAQLTGFTKDIASRQASPLWSGSMVSCSKSPHWQHLSLLLWDPAMSTDYSKFKGHVSAGDH